MNLNPPVFLQLCGGIMKRITITAILCFAFCLTGVAQNAADAPASKEDIQRYLDAIHSHDMMKQMIDAMSKPMHQMIHEQFLKDQDKLPVDFEERMNKVLDNFLNKMPFDEMMEAMIPTYQKHLTKSDINALVSFYSSPTGQKVLREMPAIMADFMQSAMPIIQRQVEKMQENIQQQVAELMKAQPKS